jgi:hypothetical protein
VPYRAKAMGDSAGASERLSGDDPCGGGVLAPIGSHSQFSEQFCCLVNTWLLHPVH